MSSSIRTAQAAVYRVLSTTDSEKTLVDVQTPARPRPRPRPRAPKPTHPHTTGAGALPISHTPAVTNVKPRIYVSKRGPLHPVVDWATTNTTSIFSGANPLVLPTRTAGREPSYAANLREMINDAVARKIHEEFEDDEDDERLRALLAGLGRVVGGANKFGRVHEEFDDEDDGRQRISLAGYGRVVGGANKFGRVRDFVLAYRKECKRYVHFELSLLFLARKRNFVATFILHSEFYEFMRMGDSNRGEITEYRARCTTADSEQKFSNNLRPDGVRLPYLNWWKSTCSGGRSGTDERVQNCNCTTLEEFRPLVVMRERLFGEYKLKDEQIVRGARDGGASQCFQREMKCGGNDKVERPPCTP
ncbi:hypothetical protein DFH06DRAFT_1142455 [Mycena polygramma]|nr:hypothetical protein DFH06DRAFT_1142455 [Mycena polygramma]